MSVTTTQDRSVKPTASVPHGLTRPAGGRSPPAAAPTLLADVEGLTRSAIAAADPRRTDATTAARPSYSDLPWSDPRLALLDTLWGDGFIAPGGADEILRIARPFGLSSSSTVLLVGAGTGAPVTEIARGTGAWVSGFEADQTLVAAARLHIDGAGLGRRTAIDLWSPARPGFRSRYFNHAIALHALRVAPVEPVLSALRTAIRPGSHIAVIETVAGDTFNPAGPVETAWMTYDNRTRPPPTAPAISRALGRLGLDIRSAADLSQRHLCGAIDGWRRYVALLEQNRPDPNEAPVLLREAETWLERARLLESGAIRLMHWHAIRQTAEF